MPPTNRGSSWIVSGELPQDAYSSLSRVAMAYVIGAGLALPLGLIMGMNKRAYDMCNPLIQFLRPIPPSAYIPLAILWFGLGNAPAVFLISIAAFFPGALFLRNALAGGRASRYPADNLFPEMDRFAQQFVNYAGHDYRLRSDSEFRRAATDGSDLGVNFVTLVRTMGARAREWLGLGASTP